MKFTFVEADGRRTGAYLYPRTRYGPSYGPVVRYAVVVPKRQGRGHDVEIARGDEYSSLEEFMLRIMRTRRMTARQMARIPMAAIVEHDEERDEYVVLVYRPHKKWRSFRDEIRKSLDVGDQSITWKHREY